MSTAKKVQNPSNSTQQCDSYLPKWQVNLISDSMLITPFIEVRKTQFETQANLALGYFTQIVKVLWEGHQSLTKAPS